LATEQFFDEEAGFNQPLSTSAHVSAQTWSVVWSAGASSTDLMTRAFIPGAILTSCSTESCGRGTSGSNTPVFGAHPVSLKPDIISSTTLWTLQIGQNFFEQQEAFPLDDLAQVWHLLMQSFFVCTWFQGTLQPSFHKGTFATFFPPNAFMAFARSLHTFNRSKKMNCKLSCKAV